MFREEKYFMVEQLLAFSFVIDIASHVFTIRLPVPWFL